MGIVYSLKSKTTGLRYIGHTVSTFAARHGGTEHAALAYPGTKNKLDYTIS